MEKQLVMLQHFNLMDEAFFLLYQWVNNGDFVKPKTTHQGETQQEAERKIKKLELVQNIFNDVRDHLLDKKDQIDYYFKERSMEFSTLASLALLWRTRSCDNELVAYEERMKNFTEEDRIFEFADIIGDEEITSSDKERLKTLSDLISFIDSSSYDKDARWDVIKIFNNQKYYYDEVYEILSEVIGLIINRHGDEIAQLEDEFEHYWSEFQRDNNIIDLINDKLKITWDCEKCTVMRPVLFLPYAIVLTINDEEENPITNSIRVGILIDKTLIDTKNQISTDDIVDIGKLLSDKSKVDILKVISKKPCYGKELATELNLSTATISYHVNALLKEGFVKADVSLNRVYYSIDLDRICEHLEDIKRFFRES